MAALRAGTQVQWRTNLWNVLTTPMATEDRVPEKDNPYAQYYVVKSGDTLSKIAEEFYGDKLLYDRIFEANRDVCRTLTRSSRARSFDSLNSPLSSQTTRHVINASCPPGGRPPPMHGGRTPHGSRYSPAPCSTDVKKSI